MDSNHVEATKNMRIVYATLINLNDRHRPRTQKDVCSITDLSSSTVCDQVQKLLKCNFLRERKGANAQRNDKTYIPGKNSGYIEDLIRLDRQYSGEYHGINGQGITYPEQDFHSPKGREHLNGGALYFNVVSEGILGSIRTFEQPHNKDLKTKLFEHSWVTKGNTPHYSRYIKLNGDLFYLHYVIGKTPDKVKFGITPPELIISKDQTSEELKGFIDQATPILAHLEKYADWKFQKDECGNYVCNAKAVQEIGLDRTITDALDDVMEGYEGVLNCTPIHRDNSIPGSEWEVTGAGSDFTAAEYFKAICNAPATEKKVNAFLQMVKEVNDRLFTAMECLNRMSMVVETDTRFTELLSKNNIQPMNQDSDGVMFR